jgi:hypothetical protein
MNAPNVAPLSLAAYSLHAALRALQWAERSGAGPYTLAALRHEVERAREALKPQPDPMDAIVRRFAEEAL